MFDHVNTQEDNLEQSAKTIGEMLQNVRFDAPVCGTISPHPVSAAQFDGRNGSLRLILSRDVEQSQPKISHHLAYLSPTGVVAPQCEGK